MDVQGAEANFSSIETYILTHLHPFLLVALRKTHNTVLLSRPSRNTCLLRTGVCGGGGNEKFVLESAH